MNLFKRLQNAFRMIFGGNSSSWWVPRTNYAYHAEVGDFMSSSVVMAPVLWFARVFPEAPLKIEQNEEKILNHDMLKLIKRPNKYYGGTKLWMATIISLLTDGNGYWLKVRNKQYKPVELWYAPHWMMTPKWDSEGTEYITHYEYTPNGRPINIMPADVVHFRIGLDPHNTRKGLSQLKSLVREVFTDDEAANFSASILRNHGVIGVVISPEGQLIASPTDVEDIKQYIDTGYRGDNRGKPLVLSRATKVQQFGFNPNEMDVSKLRNISEERVSACLGIPAAVVGFGTGLQQTKVGAPQPLSATLWTFEGPIKMGDVRIGAKIAIPGGYGEVKNIYPQGEQDIYQITFQDGSVAESTIDHLWTVKSPNEKRMLTLPLSIIKDFPYWKLRRTFVPLQGVVEFEEKETTIPPYVMGLLLADGTFRSNLNLSNLDKQIIEKARKMISPDYELKHIQNGDYGIKYINHAKGKGKGNGSGNCNPYKDELRRLGLWGKYSNEKFVPDLYKINSAKVRRELLQGLLDGDGYVNLHGQPAIEQTSRRLADDIIWLVESLGGYVLTTNKIANKKWRIIKGRLMHSNYDRYHQSIVIENGQDLFNCSYKKDRCRPRDKLPTRKFRKIEFVRREKAQCIEVEGSHYLTDHFIVTHNTMKELREMAYESGIIPVQRSLAEELEIQLLPDFEEKPDNFEIAFDYSNVRVLQEDEDKLYKRYSTGVQGGWLKVSDARSRLGWEVGPGDDIYLRQISLMEVPAGTKSATRIFTKSRKLSEAGSRLIQLFNLSEEKLRAVFEAGLKSRFEGLGKQVARMYIEEAEKIGVKKRTAITKVADPNINYPEDAAVIEQVGLRIVREINKEEVLGYKPHYIRVAKQTINDINTVFNLGVNLTDEMEFEIIEAGGKRMGLIDLTEQSKEAMFRAVKDGRQLGEGVSQIAKRIEQEVPAGRWRSAEVRSQVIARTETKYAQNVSSTTIYKKTDTVRTLMIVDGRTPTSCQHCINLDGITIPKSQADYWVEEEHPNGTRSFVPVFDEPL